MESLYSGFDKSLALGQHNEDVIAHEFEYHGIPLIRTQGKNDYDFYLPNSKSLEWKIDVRSQCTGKGLIEAKTLKRRPDYIGHIFTFAKVYFVVLYEALVERQKLLHGVGELNYDAWIVPKNAFGRRGGVRRPWVNRYSVRRVTHTGRRQGSILVCAIFDRLMWFARYCTKPTSSECSRSGRVSACPSRASGRPVPLSNRQLTGPVRNSLSCHGRPGIRHAVDPRAARQTPW